MVSKLVPWLLLTATCIVMILALFWALSIAPPDRLQGDVQRIFYFHLGSIWPSFLAFIFVLFASVMYLRTRKLAWDTRALVAGEVGWAFSSIVLITGPIWAKPTWGVYWAWDARLTSMLFLWLIFLGYVLIRDYIDVQAVRARISAILGIIGACLVPFVYMSTRIFETQHPKPVIMGDEDSGIRHPDMVTALLLSFAAFSLISLMFWWLGTRHRYQEQRALDIKRQLYLLEDQS